MSSASRLNCWLFCFFADSLLWNFSLVWRQYRWPFLSVIALSLLSAALGIGLIAFINLRLITAVDTSLRVLPEFLGLLGC